MKYVWYALGIKLGITAVVLFVLWRRRKSLEMIGTAGGPELAP